MIVRDLGDAWQVVFQPHHADLSGALARAWGNETLTAPRPHASVAHAALRHDDGWAVWERSPGRDASGAPRSFLDVQVPLHLDFYRACIASVTDDDPYAGLLVSMHGAGIYRGRYGVQPALTLSLAEDFKAMVDAFVVEQEDAYPARIAELGVSDDERWVNYKFLQLFDRLSLYFCLKDLEHGEAFEIDHIPADYAGSEVVLRIEPLGPWHVRLDPFPFAGDRAEFTLERRVVPKREWGSDEEFRASFLAIPTEKTAIVVER